MNNTTKMKHGASYILDFLVPLSGIGPNDLCVLRPIIMNNTKMKHGTTSWSHCELDQTSSLALEHNEPLDHEYLKI